MPVSNILRISFSAIPTSVDVDKLLKITQEYEYFPVDFGTSVTGTQFNSKTPEFKLLEDISNTAQKLDMPLVTCTVLAQDKYAKQIETGKADVKSIGDIDLMSRVALFPTNPQAAKNVYDFATQIREQHGTGTTLAANKFTYDAVKTIANTKFARGTMFKLKMPFPYEIEHIGDLMNENGIVFNYWREFSNPHFTASFGGGIKSDNIAAILGNIVNQQAMEKHTKISIGSSVLTKDGKMNYDEFRAILANATEWIEVQCEHYTHGSSTAAINTECEIMTPKEYLDGFTAYCKQHGPAGMPFQQPAYPFNLMRIPQIQTMAQKVLDTYAR